MSTLEEYDDVKRSVIEQQGFSCSEAAEYLKVHVGDVRGLSERSVRRYCSEHGITAGGRTKVTNEELEKAVVTAVKEVGPTFGRKMMTGYLASNGTHVAEVRVGRMLRDVHQPYHTQRSQGARNLNPLPYHAEYFGHKFHMDQNEKLVMFGAVHVLAIDGYSGKIVAWKTMPVKNNLIIYESVYRSAVLNFGMWDQIRVDHGTEFYLSLYIQEKNAHLRRNTSRLPYLQTQSKQNHRIERIWPEVNQRVNYPLKAALVRLTESDQLDMDDDLVKFTVSNLCIRLAEVGVERVVQSWNNHRIPGKGIPNVLAASNMATVISDAYLPTASVAAKQYYDSLGTRLNAEAVFGRDPFESYDNRRRCELEFMQSYPDMSVLLSAGLHGDLAPVQNAFMSLVDITRRHS